MLQSPEKVETAPDSTASPAVLPWQHAAQRLADTIIYILDHPGLSHLPRHSDESPYRPLRGHFRISLAPDNRIVADSFRTPGSFPDGMDVFVAALGASGRGYALEPVDNPRHTLVAISRENLFGPAVIVQAWRANPYPGVERSCSSNELTVFLPDEEQGRGVHVRLGKTAVVSGEIFTPFDIAYIRKGGGPHYVGLHDREVYLTSSLGDKERHLTPKYQDPQEAEVITKMCLGAARFLDRVVQNEVRRGWDYLPAVGSY